MRTEIIISSLIVSLLCITGCATSGSTISSEEDITIDLSESQEIKTIDDYEKADMKAFLTGFTDYEYPDDDSRYYKALYLSYPYLYGLILDHDSHYCTGLFYLDTQDGTYHQIAEYENNGYNMSVAYAADDYMLYWVYLLSSSDLQFFYYDVKTNESTLIFHDPDSIEMMDIYVSGDDQGFMYSCYNSEAGDYEIRYITLPEMKSKVIATHSIMPVKVGEKWYFLTASDEYYQDRYLSCYDGKSISRININTDNKRISSITALDDTHLAAVFLRTPSLLYSYVYTIDLMNYQAEYMFEASQNIESITSGGNFISWMSNTRQYGTLAYLFNWKDMQYYPLDTHFIWLDDEAMAYRKYKMPLEETSYHYTLDPDISCNSVKKLD